MNFMKRIKKAILLSLMFLMVSTIAVKGISADDDPPAEDITIGEYAYSSSIITNMLYQYTFDKTTYDEDLSDIPTEYTVDDVTVTRSAYFPDSVTMKGTNSDRPISLKVDVKYLGTNRFKDIAGDTAVSRGEKRGIMRDSDFNIRLGAFGLDYEITYTFYSDNEFKNPINVYAAIAFNDPDQANYKFPNANQRVLFYKNANNIIDEYGNTGSLNLKDFYYVKNNGLFHIYNDDPDLALPYLSWPNFKEGTFGVLLQNESTFTYKVEGKQDVLNLFSMVIMVKAPYTVEYYYEVDGEYPETADKTVTREGEIYDCPVDTDGNPLVSVTVEDKTPEIAGYSLDTTKDSEWTQILNSDGSTVLKVYFNLAYRIIYNKNATDATDPTESMTDNVYSMYDTTMPSKETWTFVRPGYAFDGFTFDDPDPTLTRYYGKQEYKDVLLADEDRTITLYAQWIPLDYHIIYDKNATDATDPTESMTNNDYTGADATMPSKETWTFVRPGYAFDGFTFDDPDPTLTRYYGKQEYKDVLLADEDRTITLYAQWKEAYTIKYDANGGDGTMTDDVYTVPADPMLSKENWTFTRPGYRFVGFKLENDGPLLRGAKDYNELLNAEDDRTITLYAQWERNIIPLTGIE